MSIVYLLQQTWYFRQYSKLNTPEPLKQKWLDTSYWSYLKKGKPKNQRDKEQTDNKKQQYIFTISLTYIIHTFLCKKDRPCSRYSIPITPRECPPKTENLNPPNLVLMFCFLFCFLFVCIFCQLSSVCFVLFFIILLVPLHIFWTQWINSIHYAIPEQYIT